MLLILMIERGLSDVLKEVEFWDHVYEEVEKLERSNFRIRHGKLAKLLEEGRSGR